MLIHELAQHTGVPTKTIRYYEDIGLLPPPARQANNYRQYTEAAVERLRFIASARSFGFSLEEIAKILVIRDAGMAPCDHALATLHEQLADIDRRIADMLALRDTLRHLYETGVTLPRDDVAFERCVCSLIKSYPEHSGDSSTREEQTYG
jgi:MerR family Zn(II)-responsive transcriptional regulator of zntA